VQLIAEKEILIGFTSVVVHWCTINTFAAGWIYL